MQPGQRRGPPGPTRARPRLPADLARRGQAGRGPGLGDAEF